MSPHARGFFWWEIDLTYYLLAGFGRLGLVRDVLPVPQHILRGDSKFELTVMLHR
jgi:stearoyl-CoA desaturase (delta-9 desaturase)